MPLTIRHQKHTLRFKFEAGTSRGVYTEKDTHFLQVFDSENPLIWGVGEAAPLVQLSPDARPDFEQVLRHICQNMEGIALQPSEAYLLQLVEEFVPEDLPSLKFALETALLDWLNQGQFLIFPSDFRAGKVGMRINGLIWMGEPAFMLEQIETKIAQGFTCLKLKVGALDFAQEYAILQTIRQQFSAEQLTLRLDANGAFRPSEAMRKLAQLAQLNIHSIEQPIAPDQETLLAELCRNSPIPIALDEELIGKTEANLQVDLLKFIKPAYIILKPTLLGGIQATKQWVRLAQEQNIGFWLTSALEANVGLNAIAQLTATLPHDTPQGLGTGALYHNNIASPLVIKSELLYYDTKLSWDSSFFHFSV